MSITFPLFEELCKEIKLLEKDITVESIYKQINKLNKDNYEIIFLIILHFYLITETKESVVDKCKKFFDNGEIKNIKFIPFDGKLSQSKTGIIFKLNSFPPTLLKLLHVFINSYSI